MKYPRLGVNIDHVATLRQQRGESYPDVVRAAEVSLATGAQQITIHLREDRRHIQDQDVLDIWDICQKMSSPLNLELGATDEMVQFALKLKPSWICFVPEKREEKTTEGGLNLLDDKVYQNIEKSMSLIKNESPHSKISLFVESSQDILERCQQLSPDAVEIHTGEYAQDFLQEKSLLAHLESFKKGSLMMKNNHIQYHAGHGLTLESVVPLLQEGDFEEYNIGHWIISESVFIGLGHVVKELMTLLKQYPLKK